MALTLNDYSKQVKDNNLLATIADWFLRNAEPLQHIEWETDKNLAVTITAWDKLPTVAFRNINESYTESTGTLQQKVESKYIMGGEIDVDVVLAEAGGTIEDVRTTQRKMKAKAMAFKFNNAFINGSGTSDPKGFVGLTQRVTDLYNAGYTSQYVDGVNPTAAGRGILYDSAARQHFIDKVNELISVIGEGAPDALYMNKKMYLAFTSCMRREQLFDQTKDMFDREVAAFHGIPLIDIGTTSGKNLAADEIITNTEDLKSGNADETSIYAVKYGVGEYFWGIQQKPLDVTDFGKIAEKPVYRDRVEWVVGLAHSHPGSIARLYGMVADSGSS